MTDEYLLERHKAPKLREGKNDIGIGECNEEFFRRFIVTLQNRNLPLAMWEPFAGHTRINPNLDYCENVPGAVLVAQDISPGDQRVLSRDSTVCGPWFRPYGMFFHPPYFGSARFSMQAGEISLIDEFREYLETLKTVVSLANLRPKGLACVVGRKYRLGGKVIDLPRKFLEVFTSCGYVLEKVWLSEPDEALLLEKIE